MSGLSRKGLILTVSDEMTTDLQLHGTNSDNSANGYISQVSPRPSEKFSGNPTPTPSELNSDPQNKAASHLCAFLS